MESEKERAAEEVLNAKGTFEMALSNKRKYPLVEFSVFARATRKYIAVTAGDRLIHRRVAGDISGLSEYLKAERKRVQDDVLCEADRLQCLLFSGYDPYFESDAPPPGLCPPLPNLSTFR